MAPEPGDVPAPTLDPRSEGAPTPGGERESSLGLTGDQEARERDSGESAPEGRRSLRARIADSREGSGGDLGRATPRPTLPERIRLNRNKKTRPEVQPVHSTAVEYGGDNLSQQAPQYGRDYRDPVTGENVGYWGESNVSVFKYRDIEEQTQYHATKSVPRGNPLKMRSMHSEPRGLIELEQMGVTPDRIMEMFTEREPCMGAGNYCSTLLSSEMPGVPVSHSLEFGANAASQEAGSAAMKAALRRHEQEWKQQQKLKGGSQ